MPWFCFRSHAVETAVPPPGLARMKAVALALLAGAAALYVTGTVMQGGHPAWDYLTAFGEAAMVGAVADWFAVVALFRHPLGLPIPHTAIIPANKDRIGENLASFLCANFLSTPQVLARLRSFDAAGRLARWLSTPQHARQAAGHLGATLAYALGALDDRRVRRFVGGSATDLLSRLLTAPRLGRWLALATHEGRHQPLLDTALRRFATLADNESLKARLADAVAGEVRLLRYVGLDTAAGRYATNKLLAGVIRLMHEMSEDPQHPLRGELDAWLAALVQRLESDPALVARVDEFRARLLAHPALGVYLQTLWGHVVAWMQRDLAGDDSVLRERVAGAIRLVGKRLQADEGMRQWIDAQLNEVAPRWIERYREDIRRYIVARVREWNAEEMTAELERNIGRDLQFIRINGTLVGGLVGVLIHAATQIARAI